MLYKWGNGGAQIKLSKNCSMKNFKSQIVQGGARGPGGLGAGGGGARGPGG